MRLWLLRRSDPRLIYDTNEGFVIRAESEAAARGLANSQAADEGAIWEDPAASSCEPLDHDGSRGIVLIDFNAG